MKKATEDILRDVAGLVIKSVDASWSEVTVEIDAQEENVLSLQGSYLKSIDDTEISFPVDPKVAHLLRNFREQFQDEGAELWSGATIKIDDQGQFVFELHYD